MTSRQTGLCRAVLSLLVAAAPLSACDRLSCLIPGTGSSPTAAGVSEPQGASPRGEAVLPGLEGAVIEIAGDRVTLRARQAPRVHLLQEFGERAGFRVTAGPIEPKQISVDLEAVSLAAAVRALLHDVPHGLSYEPDPEAGAPRLAMVRVGGAQHLAKRRERRREALAGVRERLGRGKDDADLTPEQRAMRERMAEARDRWRAARERAPEDRAERRRVPRTEPPENPEVLLDDPDPEVRGRAVGWIEPDGEGLARLQTALAEDPDPGVRAAAAYRLVGADSFGAARSLIAALADPEPEVVLAAIDTLEYLHDPALIPDLEPLLGHPDPEVRDAAAEAIDFLR